MEATTAIPADRPWTTLSAHWKVGGRRVCLLSVEQHADGSITGIAAGHDNGFTSSPDRLVTLDARKVRKLRVRLLGGFDA